MEFAALVIVRDHSTECVVIRRVDHASRTGLFAVLHVVGMAVREDRQLEHHRSVLALAGHSELLVVLEFVRVTPSVVIGGGLPRLLSRPTDINVAARVPATVSDLATA